jgi:hypothetical protein
VTPFYLTQAYLDIFSYVDTFISRKSDSTFNNKFSTANMLLAKIKDEVALWNLAGAKGLV